MTRKKQIIEILEKYSVKRVYFNSDDSICAERINVRDEVVDAILALPLEVPSDKELDDEAFSRRYQKNNEFDAMYADAFIYGADWMKNEIIKRNTNCMGSSFRNI